MQESYNIRDSYKYYKKNATSPVTIKIYLGIVIGFIQFIMEQVFNGYDVVLPARLGRIGIRGKKVKPRVDENGKIKGLAPNWGETRKLWESNPEAKEKRTIMYCFNEHTNGLRFKITWFKKTALFHNKSVYSFKASRANKRATTAKVNNGAEYIEKHTNYGNK